MKKPLIEEKARKSLKRGDETMHKILYTGHDDMY